MTEKTLLEEVEEYLDLTESERESVEDISYEGAVCVSASDMLSVVEKFLAYIKAHSSSE